MNLTRKDILINSVRATLGLMLFSVGVHLAIRANIGVAPWDVFCIGLADTLGILYGTASVLISVVLIIVDLILGEKIGLGTILDAIVVGKTVDLLNWLNIIPESTSIWMSIIMLVISFFIEGFAQYLYMRTALCCGPRDSLQIGICRRMPKVPVGVVNIIMLAVVLIIGWLLGGPIGIGTALSPVGIGLLQQLSFNMMKFNPKEVQHQGIFESAKVLFGTSKE